ncbi:MAG: tetratricopeptide repeat protein [Usitatibacter sp.]
MKWLSRAWLAASLVLAALPCIAVESDPLPVPEGARGKAIALYNEGVKVMLDKRYAQAQRLFEQALDLEEGIAEAHNNLAFSLRMQSRDNFARSLKHYQRALEINPKLAQAYMYRGVLYSQMGDMKRALEDLERLQVLDKSLATKLEGAIAQASRDERDGLAPQLDIY